jgi:hypothetical protein
MEQDAHAQQGFCRFFPAMNVPSEEEIRPGRRLPIRYAPSPISNSVFSPAFSVYAALASSPSWQALHLALAAPRRVPCRSSWRMCPAQTLLPLQLLARPPRHRLPSFEQFSSALPWLPKLITLALCGSASLRDAEVRLSLAAAQGYWSGRGDLNARPPAPKGQKSVPRAPSCTAES